MPMPGMTASLDRQINTKRLLLADAKDPVAAEVLRRALDHLLDQRLEISHG